MIIFDCEIKKGILSNSTPKIDGIEYCKGWKDYAGMGISVICAYDYSIDRYRNFCDDNLQEFQELVNNSDLICGFNNIGFDNPLCSANKIEIPEKKSYDLLAETWKAIGGRKKGYALDNLLKANFKAAGKTGHGAMAPVQWQRGEIGAVIDYCLADVWNTKKLIDKVIRTGHLIDPVNGELLRIRRPE